MVTKISAPSFIWIDLEQATPEVIAQTVKEFRLHPLLEGELVRMTRVSKIDRYGDAVLLVLQVPYVAKARGDVKTHELDFVIGKNFLLTNSSAPIPAVMQFRKRLSDPKIKERYFKRDTGALLYAILLRVFNRILPVIDNLEHDIETIEEGLFEGKEQLLIPKVSLMHRNIIDLRRALNPARSVLDAFLAEIKDWFDPRTTLRLRSLNGLSRRVTYLLDVHLETIAALEQTTQAIFSTKINEVIRILTFLTAMALPFTVIGTLYGMNIGLEGLPPLGFAGLVALMAVSSFGMLAVFRLKRWI